MPQSTATSSQFTVGLRDVLKGLTVAIITPVITIIIDSLNKGSLTFDWKAIGITALTAGLAYIVKNFFTPAQIVIKGAEAEQVAAVKSGTAEVTVTPT